MAVPHMQPKRVGPYEILLPLGSGGMATVYLARIEAGGVERMVAVKVLHPHLREQAEWTTEIAEEAKIAGAIRHANVVKVLDVGDDGEGGVYLVMEYVEGEVLSGLMRRVEKKHETVPRAIAMRILVDALSGLHAAHEAKDPDGRILDLVHRDVSPQNILVGVDGVVRLTDFGIAKVATRLRLTRTGVVKGKAAYMSPEQARAQPIDRRTDVFAAGVLAWELLAGKGMYPAMNEMATMLLIISNDAPRLSTAVPDIDPGIDEAIAHALARDPAARMGTADELRRRLLAASGGEIADVADVAAYVSEAVGSAIVERRSRAITSVTGRVTGPVTNSATLLTPAANVPGVIDLSDEARTIHTGASPIGAPRGLSRPAMAAIAATVLGVLVVSGIALVRRASRSEVPVETTEVSASSANIEDGLVAEAERLCAAGDCQSAHERIQVGIPDGSPVRQRADVRALEARWAETTVSSADRDPDLRGRHRLLEEVIANTSVDEPTKARARTALEQVKKAESVALVTKAQHADAGLADAGPTFMDTVKHDASALRATLLPKVKAGKASRQETLVLHTICSGLKDKACMAICDEHLR
jgi:serine/threonine-protein kinase